MVYWRVCLPLSKNQMLVKYEINFWGGLPNHCNVYRVQRWHSCTKDKAPVGKHSASFLNCSPCGCYIFSWTQLWKIVRTWLSFIQFRLDKWSWSRAARSFENSVRNYLIGNRMTESFLMAWGEKLEMDRSHQEKFHTFKTVQFHIPSLFHICAIIPAAFGSACPEQWVDAEVSGVKKSFFIKTSNRIEHTFLLWFVGHINEMT